MNPEAQKILETLKPFHPGVILDRYDAANIHKLISIETARLHAIIAEDQTNAAKKVEEQTDQLIFFTKVLVGLTVALFLLTAYLSYDAYLKNKAIDQAQHSSTK